MAAGPDPVGARWRRSGLLPRYNLRDFRRELSWRGRVGLKSCLQVQLDRIASVNTIEHGSKVNKVYQYTHRALKCKDRTRVETAVLSWTV